MIVCLSVHIQSCLSSTRPASGTPRRHLTCDCLSVCTHTELSQQYPAGQRDSSEATALLQELTQLTERLQPRLLVSDNRVKLMELQRDLVGCDALLAGAETAGRRFVREGCLQKLSKKGYQHRMFFLVRCPTGGLEVGVKAGFVVLYFF